LKLNRGEKGVFDMIEKLVLSAEEANIVLKNINRFKCRARNWRRNRVIILSLSVAAILWGVSNATCIFSLTETDVPTFVERLENVEIPEGKMGEYWFVGELRRTALLFEIRQEYIVFTLLDFLVGIGFMIGGIIVAVMTVLHWNDDSRNATLAKICQHYVDTFLIVDTPAKIQ
jgi:hypothetical protein